MAGVDVEGVAPGLEVGSQAGETASTKPSRAATDRCMAQRAYHVGALLRIARLDGPARL
jgi:hypothetical protein